MKYESKAHKRAQSYSNSRKALKIMREEMQALVDQANNYVNQLLAAGATSEDNAALAEAERSLTKSKERKSDKMFSVDDKHRLRELRREAARLDKFLSSPQANVDVYIHERPALKAMEKYNLDFKRQHENFVKTGNRFGDVDDERFKFAARIYRHLEETNANIYGTGGYGSNKLINLIYDAVEGYDPNAPERVKNKIEANAMKLGQQALTEHAKMVEMGFFSNTPYQNIDVGVISRVRNSTTAEDFLSNLNDNLS